MKNNELLELYWQLGADIVERQKNSKWGDKLLTQLSQDLMTSFPDMKGFSKRNLEQIRRWFCYWNAEPSIAQQAVAQLVKIPWGHNIHIITKCHTIEEAGYYVQSTLEHGWSRNVLVHQVEALQHSLPTVAELEQLGDEHE